MLKTKAASFRSAFSDPKKRTSDVLVLKDLLSCSFGGKDATFPTKQRSLYSQKSKMSAVLVSSNTQTSTTVLPSIALIQSVSCHPGDETELWVGSWRFVLFFENQNEA